MVDTFVYLDVCYTTTDYVSECCVSAPVIRPGW